MKLLSGAGREEVISVRVRRRKRNYDRGAKSFVSLRFGRLPSRKRIDSLVEEYAEFPELGDSLLDTLDTVCLDLDIVGKK